MNTLRKTVNEKDEESRKRQSMLDAKLQELEQMKTGTCQRVVLLVFVVVVELLSMKCTYQGLI